MFTEKQHLQKVLLQQAGNVQQQQYSLQTSAAIERKNKPCADFSCKKQLCEKTIRPFLFSSKKFDCTILSRMHVDIGT